jgi:glycosyltransferase involved in cell wall biosynthesis
VGELARGRLRHLLLSAALRNASVSTIFSLDPLFAQSMGGVQNRTKIVSIPDVAHGSIDRAAVDARGGRWRIEPGRATMLMFGALAARKGIGTLGEALTLLPPGCQARLAVVFCGRPVPSERQSISEMLGGITRRTDVQIVVDEQDLHFTEVQSAFEAADLVLVPYLRHIGSSAVLVRAAAAGKPVVASDFGLVGHYVRTQSLGRVVDTRDTSALAHALEEALDRPLDGFRIDRARRFARCHGPELMADAIIESMSATRQAAPTAEAA